MPKAYHGVRSYYGIYYCCEAANKSMHVALKDLKLYNF